jgi:basic membrane lipoprotein Med (substrate-binding protein (PBP1-ABC) superfamily)
MKKCKKRAHTTIENAEKEAIGSMSKNDNLSLTPYLCSDCGKYHITSMSKKTYNKVKKIQKERELDLEVEYWKHKKGWE